MSNWVLWSRPKGIACAPIARHRGTLAQCEATRRDLEEATTVTGGKMPYPPLDLVIVPRGQNPTMAFHEADPFPVSS